MLQYSEAADDVILAAPRCSKYDRTKRAAWVLPFLPNTRDLFTALVGLQQIDGGAFIYRRFSQVMVYYQRLRTT
jgi:hypothetical protein